MTAGPTMAQASTPGDSGQIGKVKRLDLLFNELNQKFFAGRLRRYKVRRCRLPNLEGRCDNKNRIIRLSSSLQESEVRRTLLHEMCHVRGGGNHHGRKWANEMLRLAAAGESWVEEDLKRFSDPRETFRRFVKTGPRIDEEHCS